MHYLESKSCLAMLDEAIKKAKKSSDEAIEVVKEEAIKELGKAREADNEAAFNSPKAFTNLSLDIAEILAATYSPRNL